MENVEQVKNEAAGEGSGSRRPQGLERALRDLIPVTLAAGAAAVAVAVAVGGSASRLLAPFAQGPRAGDVVTSTPATAPTAAGQVTVRLGPKAKRMPPLGPVGLGADLLAAAPTVVRRVLGGEATEPDAAIFAPGRLIGAPTLPEAVGPPGSGAGEVSEVVLPVPAPVEVTAPGAVVAPAVQSTQAVQRPRRLKSPKAGRPEGEAESSIFRAASASSFTLLAKAAPEAASATAEESAAEKGDGRGHGQGEVRGKAERHDEDKGKAKDKDRGKDKDKDRGKPAGDNRPGEG